jgi:hypothetical protein
VAAPVPVAAPPEPVAPAPAPTPEPAPVAPPAASSAPTLSDTAADADGVVRKKIIKPLDPTTAATPPDLNALLAKEGITDFDKDEQAAVNNNPGNPTDHSMPHPPGHVISPNPTGADGKPIDPNSIAL